VACFAGRPVKRALAVFVIFVFFAANSFKFSVNFVAKDFVNFVVWQAA
jgi:hypothetical protein